MKQTDKKIICELNILKNRLESGESPIQCLQTMGTPLHGDKDFISKWEKLSQLLIEGKITPSKAIGEFCEQLESRNKLLQLCQQKSFAARMQAIVSLCLSVFILFSSILFFPAELKPSLAILSISSLLTLASLYCMRLLLKNFESQFSFLDWITFQRNISLSLQCGMTLPHALHENQPLSRQLKSWPIRLRKTLAENLKHNFDTESGIIDIEDSSLWKLALRSWSTVVYNYKQGLSQATILNKLCQLQEDEFKNEMMIKSEKLSYLLLIPLFALSVPAVLILLFGPILSNLGIN